MNFIKFEVIYKKVSFTTNYLLLKLFLFSNIYEDLITQSEIDESHES